MANKTTAQYQEVISRCQEVLKKKCADYGTAWRIMRLSSFTDQIFIKARRIVTIQQRGKQVNEGVATELMGIINYSALALIQMDLAGDLRLEIPCDEVCTAYEGWIAKIMGLLVKKA